uniref:Uncharacterized protein n=1 Tax=Alexandrium monilatum TaxID=311494 RepID=A0A7S4QQW2_9DINO
MVGGLDVQTAKELKFIREQTTHCAGDVGALRRELSILRAQQEDLSRELSSVAGTVWEREKRLELGSHVELKACHSKVVGLEKELQGQKACQNKVVGLEKEVLGQGNQLDALRQYVRDIEHAPSDAQPSIRELRAVLKYDLNQDIDRKMALQKIAVDRERDALCSSMESRVDSIAEKVSQVQATFETSRRSAQAVLDDRLCNLEAAIMSQVGRELEALNKVSHEMGACNAEVHRLKEAIGSRGMAAGSPEHQLLVSVGSPPNLSPGSRMQHLPICERLEQLERLLTDADRRRAQDLEAARRDFQSLEAAHHLHHAQQSSTATQLASLQKICQDLADKQIREFESSYERLDQITCSLREHHSQLAVQDEIGRRVVTLEGRLSAEAATSNARLEQALARLSVCEGQGASLLESQKAHASTISDLKVGHSAVAKEVAELHTKEASLAERLSSLHGDVASAATRSTADSEALRAAHAVHMRELEAAKVSQREQHAAAHARLERAEGALANLAERHGANAEEAAALRSQHGSLRERLEAVDSCLGGLAERHTSQLEALRGTHAESVKQLADAHAAFKRDAHERLAMCEQQHKTSVASLEAELTRHQEVHASFEREADSRLALCEQQKMSISGLQAELAHHLDAHAVFKREADSRLASCEQHKASVANLQTELAHHRDAHANFKREADDRLTLCEQQKALIMNLQTELARHGDTHASFKRETDERLALGEQQLQLSLASLQQDVAHHQSRQASFEKEADGRLASCEQHRALISSLQHELAQQRDAHDGFKREADERHAAFKREAEDRLASCEQQRASIASLQRDLAQHQDAHDGFRREAGERLALCEQQKASVASLQRDLAQHQDRLAACEQHRASIANLQRDLAQHQEAHAGFRREAEDRHAVLKREAEDRLASCEQHRASIASLQKELAHHQEARTSFEKEANGRLASCEQQSVLVANLQKEAASLHAQHGSLCERVDALNSCLGNLAERHAGQLEVVRGAQAESLKQLADAHAGFAKEVGERLAACERHGSLLAHLQAELAQHKDTHASFKREAVERVASCEQHGGLIASLQTELAAHKDAHASLKREAGERLTVCEERHEASIADLQKESAALRSHEATLRERVEAVDSCLAGITERHAGQLEALKGSLSETMKQLADTHANFKREADGRLAVCEQQKLRITDLQKELAGLRDERVAREAQLLDRVARFEVQLGDGLAKHGAALDDVKAASARQAHDTEAAAMSRHAAAVERLEFLERAIGSAADGHRKDAAANGTKLEQLDSRLAVCEAFHGQHSALCARVDGLEGQLGEYPRKLSLEAQALREVQARHSADLEGLRAASTQHGGAAERLAILERSLGSVTSKQSEALAKLDRLGDRLHQCEGHGPAISELRRGQLAVAQLAEQVRVVEMGVQEVKAAQEDLGKVRGVLSNVRRAWDHEPLAAGAAGASGAADLRQGSSSPRGLALGAGGLSGTAGLRPSSSSPQGLALGAGGVSGAAGLRQSSPSSRGLALGAGGLGSAAGLRQSSPSPRGLALGAGGLGGSAALGRGSSPPRGLALGTGAGRIGGAAGLRQGSSPARDLLLGAGAGGVGSGAGLRGVSPSPRSPETSRRFGGGASGIGGLRGSSASPRRFAA